MPTVQSILSMPLAARFLLAVNLGALAFAATLQFGFDVRPCVLCLWQRVPFGAAAIFSAAALFWKPFGKNTALLLALCALAYIAGVGVAFFHTGVELHWWLGTSGCAVSPVTGATPEDLRNALLQTIAPRCDEKAWTLFGLSLANLNLIASPLLALFAAAATVKCIEK